MCNPHLGEKTRSSLSRNRAADISLVADTLSPDLFICAKDLFVEAKPAAIAPDGVLYYP